MRPLLPTALAGLLLAPVARADAPPPPAPAAVTTPAAAPAPASTPKRKAQGPRKKRAGKKVKRDPKAPAATFPGFRILEDKRTRVSVEISQKVSVSEHKAQGRVTYRLQGAVVPDRNNRLPLDTLFFATPVARVQLVEVDKDTDLVIDLKQPAEPTFRLTESEGGVILQVDFPAPTEQPTAPAKRASTPVATSDARQTDAMDR
jgi:hypothetical protein